MNLRKDFQDHVAKSAFKMVDGALRIVGKYGEIEIVGDMYDIYFVGRKEPLSARRITNIAEKLKQEAGLIKLDGEAYIQTSDLELARLTLPLLGVRRRKIYSDETLAKMKARMADVRKYKGGNK